MRSLFLAASSLKPPNTHLSPSSRPAHDPSLSSTSSFDNIPGVDIAPSCAFTPALQTRCVLPFLPSLIIITMLTKSLILSSPYIRASGTTSTCTRLRPRAGAAALPSSFRKRFCSVEAVPPAARVTSRRSTCATAGIIDSSAHRTWTRSLSYTSSTWTLSGLLKLRDGTRIRCIISILLFVQMP